MIRITKDTYQKLLLAELGKVSTQPGDLVIQVESLPIFLSTGIAFKIFHYQLRTYPRAIVWKTDHKDIEELFLKAGIVKDTSIKTNSYNIDTQITPQNESKDVVPVSAFSSVLNTLEGDNKASHQKEHRQITLQSVFDSEKKHPRNEEAKSTKSLQDLDNWIDRIEATKKALNNLKNDFTQEVEQHASALTPFVKTPKLLFNLPKSFSIISVFFIASLVLASCVIFFPTSAYTLEIRPPHKSSTINLIIPFSSFNQEGVSISADTKIPSSGISANQSERATGTVDIVNKTSKPFDLAKGSFSLVNEGKTYIHLANSTLPEKLNVTELNESAPLAISIQATEIGEEYTLPKGTIFDIIDIYGAKPCSSCFGIASSAIQGQKPADQKIVSENDHQLLRNTVDGKLAQKRIESITKFRNKSTTNEDIIIDPSWYRNTESTFAFNKDIGDLSNEVSLKADVTSSLYYLPQSIVNNILKTENPEIQTVDSIELLESQGKFDDSKGDIKIKLMYRYSLKVDLDREKVKQDIVENDGKDFVSTQETIRKQYSVVSNIQKQHTGLRVPGIKPAVNVKFVTLKD
jgi:hypothetical protein